LKSIMTAAAEVVKRRNRPPQVQGHAHPGDCQGAMSRKPSMKGGKISSSPSNSDTLQGRGTATAALRTYPIGSITMAVGRDCGLPDVIGISGMD
jgi:hypothetical protein